MSELSLQRPSLEEVEMMILCAGGVAETDYEKTITPVVHRFTPGLYIRELHMPAGVVCTSRIHKTTHPFVVSSGSYSVYSDANGSEFISAPYCGITEPGTRRLFFVHEDTVLTTFHPTSSTDVYEIEEEILEPLEAHTSLRYDAEEFRELTKRVFAAEKVGFWSDWTHEEQEMYMADDWRGFSRSRGYSEEEINDYMRWRAMAVFGSQTGHTPIKDTLDLIVQSGLKNIARDTSGEIAKSSVVHAWMRGLK